MVMSMAEAGRTGLGRHGQATELLVCTCHNLDLPRNGDWKTFLRDRFHELKQVLIRTDRPNQNDGAILSRVDGRVHIAKSGIGIDDCLHVRKFLSCDFHVSLLTRARTEWNVCKDRNCKEVQDD